MLMKRPSEEMRESKRKLNEGKKQKEKLNKVTER